MIKFRTRIRLEPDQAPETCAWYFATAGIEVTIRGRVAFYYDASTAPKWQGRTQSFTQIDNVAIITPASRRCEELLASMNSPD
jgi:hypothetical protein